MIWWNMLYNRATNVEHIQGFFIASLSTNLTVDSFNIESGHSCFNCSCLLDGNSAEICDGLPQLESLVPEDTKIVLLYIGGHITRNGSGSSEGKLLN